MSTQALPLEVKRISMTTSNHEVVSLNWPIIKVHHALPIYYNLYIWDSVLIFSKELAARRIFFVIGYLYNLSS